MGRKKSNQDFKNKKGIFDPNWEWKQKNYDPVIDKMESEQKSRKRAEDREMEKLLQDFKNKKEHLIQTGNGSKRIMKVCNSYALLV